MTAKKVKEITKAIVKERVLEPNAREATSS